MLSLLELPKGPVLQDYPVDASDVSGTGAQLACPVNFEIRQVDSTPTDTLLTSFEREILTMQTWYDLASDSPSHGPHGASRLEVFQIKQLFADFIQNKTLPQPAEDCSLADQLRLAAEDLKTYYFTAISAQPGQPTEASQLANWFWGETYAAVCINEVRKRCLQYETKDMQLAGKLLLVPRNQMHRFQD